MRTASFIITMLLLPLFFLSCSSKNYFEPQSIEGRVLYSGELPAGVIDVKRGGATLANGEFIAGKNVVEHTLEEGFLFISADAHNYYAANDCGEMLIIDKESLEATKRSFASKVLSAASDEGYMALLLSDNSVRYYDDAQNLLYENSSESPLSATSKVAKPLFLKDIVLIPMLDGKIHVLDKRSGEHIRDIVVSSQKRFTNVIFLDVLSDRLVAATPKKVISVAPDVINYFDAEIRDVIFVRSGIYIFTKDGRIVLTDINLNKTAATKHGFAHYTGAIHGRYIYALEKQGYVIASDVDLYNSYVYEFPEEIESPVYMSGDTIYYEDRYFRLNLK